MSLFDSLISLSYSLLRDNSFVPYARRQPLDGSPAVTVDGVVTIAGTIVIKLGPTSNGTVVPIFAATQINGA